MDLDRVGKRSRSPSLQLESERGGISETAAGSTDGASREGRSRRPRRGEAREGEGETGTVEGLFRHGFEELRHRMEEAFGQIRQEVRVEMQEQLASQVAALTHQLRALIVKREEEGEMEAEGAAQLAGDSSAGGAVQQSR